MTDELKKAELAAHAYDGLGAPMSAYRPHIAELRRQVLDPMFAATRESQGQPVDAEPRACKHNWLAHVPVGQMQTASYICGFCGEQKPAAQEPVKAALRAYAEASKDTHCPICGGRESCDHTVRERLLAALIPPSRAGKAVDDNPLTPMSGFLVFLKDMRFTGSWDLPTLNRAIEVGETIAEQSLAVPPLGAAEPVAWQWRALEDGEPRTAWKDPELGDRPGWEALAKQNPEKYATERRALYSVPQPSDATPQAVAPTEEIGEIIERLKKWSDLAEFERILGHWDAWRKYIREGGGGSWPRDAFESLVDAFGQDGADAATALTALSAEHRRRGSKIIEMTEQIGAQMCRAESAEAMMEGSMANRITEKMVEAALDATGFRNAEYSRKWMRRALEAALSREPGQQEWQPIETAPTDEGVSVLLGWALEGNWPPCIGFWSGDYHGAHAWCDDATENDFTPQPTHWQPLPAAPAARALLHNGGKE